MSNDHDPMPEDGTGNLDLSANPSIKAAHPRIREHLVIAEQMLAVLGHHLKPSRSPMLPCRHRLGD